MRLGLLGNLHLVARLVSRLGVVRTVPSVTTVTMDTSGHFTFTLSLRRSLSLKFGLRRNFSQSEVILSFGLSESLGGSADDGLSDR